MRTVAVYLVGLMPAMLGLVSCGAPQGANNQAPSAQPEARQTVVAMQASTTSSAWDEKSDCAPGAPPNSLANALDILKVHCDRDKAIGKLALLGVIALAPELDAAEAGVATEGGVTVGRVTGEAGAMGDVGGNAGVEGAVSRGRISAEAKVELERTIARVGAGEELPYAQDGSPFSNAGGKLPDGEYKEYTVETPGAEDRGARRLVIEQKTGAMYYTEDHYETFYELREEDGQRMPGGGMYAGAAMAAASSSDGQGAPSSLDQASSLNGNPSAGLSDAHPQDDAMLSGAARLISPNLLDIDGRVVGLSGIDGDLNFSNADELNYIISRNGPVRCWALPRLYRCQLSSGMDLSSLIIGMSGQRRMVNVRSAPAEIRNPVPSYRYHWYGGYGGRR